MARFLNAQEMSYETALREIKNGCKESHWMWYIFPQLYGLGSSPTAMEFGIRGFHEAVAYLEEPTLKSRFIEISQALLALPENNATTIFGKPDDMKLKSSMTLFSTVAPEITVFQKVLDKFFDGQSDSKTIELLKHAPKDVGDILELTKSKRKEQGYEYQPETRRDI